MKRILILAVFIPTMVFAVGPKIPFILTWTPSPSPDVTGYWFYVRATNGVYTDTMRWPVGTGEQGKDLRTLGLAKGDYYVAMSATNAVGAESDLSAPDFLWRYSNPNKPSNVNVQ